MTNRIIGQLLCLAVFSACPAAWAQTNAPRWVEVTAESAPLQGMDSKGNVSTIATVTKGTRLQVAKTQKTWFMVSVPNRKEFGWIDGQFVAPIEQGGDTDSQIVFPNNQFFTTKDKVPVEDKGQIIGHLRSNQLIWVFEIRDGRCRVRVPPTPRQGWVDAKLISMRRMTPQLQGLHQKALQLAEESRRLSSKKEFQAAIEKAKLSAEVHAAVYGADHPATIREQISVGWMTIRLGNKSAGQKIIDDAVRKEQAVFGDNAIDSLSTYRLVARFALDGDAASAEKWYRKVFAVLDKKYAKNKTELVAARQHELQTLVSAGDMGIARTFCQQTLDRIQELGMVGSELAAIEFTNMAAILTRLGEVDGALEYYQRALNVPEEAMSAQLRATVLAFIGEIYRDQQEYLEADKYMTQAVAFSRRGYGEKHTTTARHLFTLGWNKYFLADYESGIELLNECLAIRKTLPQGRQFGHCQHLHTTGIHLHHGRTRCGRGCLLPQRD